MKNKVIYVIISIILVLFSGNKAEATAKKHILYLATGTSTQKMTQDLLDGFTEYIGDDTEMYVEYVGNVDILKKNWDEMKIDMLESVLDIKREYYGHIDAVVCAGDFAAKVILNSKDMVDDVPLVFLGVSDPEIIKEGERIGVKYIFEQSNLLASNVELLADLYKKKRIVLITGPEKYNKRLIQEFEDLKSQYKHIPMTRYSIQYKGDNELKKIESELDSKRDVVLYTAPLAEVSMYGKIFGDEARDNFRSTYEMLIEISKRKNIPIYSNTYSSIEDGLCGGYSIDLRALGNLCAQRVNQSDLDSMGATIKYPARDAERLVIEMPRAIGTGIQRSAIPDDARRVAITSIGTISYKARTELMFVTSIIAISVIAVFIYKFIQLKARSAEIWELKNKAEEANETKNSFMNNITHELKTPVTVISSASQLMQKLMKSEQIDIESMHDLLKVVDQNSSRLVRLINNILDLTKSEVVFDSAEINNIEVVSFIESSVMSVVPYVKKKGLKLVFDTDEEEVIMAVDINKIDRVVLNLLSNAIKFSKEDGVIYVNLKVEDDNLVIEVKDQGIGIPQERINDIFEKFLQLDTSLNRLNEGSGIGLSLVKHFVDMHNGTVDVQSKVGEGSVFTVKIPITIAPGQEIIYNVPRDRSVTACELSDIYH